MRRLSIDQTEVTFDKGEIENGYTSAFGLH